MDGIRPGKYLHYKGEYYTLIATAKHTETGEDLAIYYDKVRDVWVCPLSMFLERVGDVPRFEFVTEQCEINPRRGVRYWKARAEMLERAIYKYCSYCDHEACRLPCGCIDGNGWRFKEVAK